MRRWIALFGLLVVWVTPLEARQDPGAADTVDVVPLPPLSVQILRAPMRLDASPLAVGALGEQELRQARSGAFLEEALRGLPGVQVQNRYNYAVGERLSVRGFGGRAQFGVRGSRVVVDGIPATLPDGQTTIDHLDMGSLGRVEVIRGTSSALFGNASGGVLSFETRSPGPEPVRIEVETAGGSHGLLRHQATASGTVNETGYLVTVSRLTWDGYRSNPQEEGTTYGAAERLGVNARIVRPLAGGLFALTANILDLDSENPGSLARSFIEDRDRTAFGVGPFSNVARRTGKELRQDQVGIRWDGRLAGLDADFSLFGIRRSMVNPIPPTIIGLDRDAGGLRAQVSRAESTMWGPLHWFAGVEADLMFDDRLNFVNDAGSRGALTVDQRERVRSAGLFLQANLPLPGAAEALAGLRYDRHDFRAWDHFPRAADDPSRTGERTMEAVSPSVGVNVPVSPAFTVFANVGTVFETPSTTELGNRPDGEGGFNPDLDPQRGTSGEVGIRGNLADVAVFEVTTYRTNLRNELVRFQVAEFAGRDFFRNAGKSRHTGVEASLSAASSTGLLRGDVTYTRTDARYRSFEWDGETYDGNRIPGLAPNRIQSTLRINPAFAFGEISATYLDGIPVNDANSEFSPSYVVVDFRAGVRGLDVGGVSVAPWAAIANVFDRYFITYVVPNAAGNRFYEPGPGRSFQLGARATWGSGT